MTARKHRVALFGPSSEFYAHQLRSFDEGFRSLGHECFWDASFLPLDALNTWVRENEITLVLEINRVLPPPEKWPAGAAWPKEVPHFCWMQDYRSSMVDITQDIGVSDYLYFLVEPTSFGIQMPKDRPWSILSPGARADIPAPQGPASRCDFSLCGFIPWPVPPHVAIATAADGSPVVMETFLRAFPTQVLSHLNFSFLGIRQAVEDTCRRQNWKFNNDFLFVIDEVLVRTLERVYVVDTLLDVSKNTELWGRLTWRDRPKFRPYYKGHLLAHELETKVYQHSRVNIHNGAVSLHFRLFDCLAAGGFMLVNKTPYDDWKGNIAESFTDGVHYVSYTLKTLADVARKYLNDPEARQAIAAEGRRKVMAEHTWAHRAQQVLADLEQLPKFRS